MESTEENTASTVFILIHSSTITRLTSEVVHGFPPDARALASGGSHDVGHVDASVLVGVTVRKESMVMVSFDG
jgi:hypothetical protein